MNESNNALIQALVAGHTRRPWWKSLQGLLTVWFSFNVIYFIALSLLKLNLITLRSSFLYPFLLLLGVIISGWVFAHLARSSDEKASSLSSVLFLILSLIFVGFSLEYGLGHILHQREISLTAGDFNCFWHSVASSAGPVLLFPILFRKFFIQRPGWAITFMSIQISLMASLLTELKCPDRELWHLLFGHQTVVVGVGLIILGITLIGQNLFSLKPSGPEKWKP
jgi:hypothetical protein